MNEEMREIIRKFGYPDHVRKAMILAYRYVSLTENL